MSILPARISARPQDIVGLDLHFIERCEGFCLVRVRGFEPLRPFRHEDLSLMCLPIPPDPHIKESGQPVKRIPRKFARYAISLDRSCRALLWSQTSDLNRNALLHRYLRPACLPIPPVWEIYNPQETLKSSYQFCS